MPFRFRLPSLLAGIVAGAMFGYLAALFIAHERWAFLAEYAPVVTLVAVIGAYFAAMYGIAQWLTYVGGNFARLMEFGFLIAASVAALLLLPSRRLRGWLRVTLVKHLFQHRYDYREEWLRFTRTMGNCEDPASPLEQRAVQAIADIADSPAGLLLAPGDQVNLAPVSLREYESLLAKVADGTLESGVDVLGPAADGREDALDHRGPDLLGRDLRRAGDAHLLLHGRDDAELGS